MAPGRPRLRIGQHGRINRHYLGGGVWEASCRYRDADGVVRKVQRLGPADEFDKHGKLAEDTLVEALAERRALSADQIGLDTLLVSLVDQHLTRLAEDGRSPATLHTYRFTAGKLANSSAVCGWGKRRRHGLTRRCGPCGPRTVRRWHG